MQTAVHCLLNLYFELAVSHIYFGQSFYYLRSSITGILYPNLISLFSGHDCTCRVRATYFYYEITLHEVFNIHGSFVCASPGIIRIKTFKSRLNYVF